MQFGHFDSLRREYVIDRPDTPRPWSNYIGTTEYGGIVTNNAGGYSFYKSAAQGRFLRLRFNAVPLDQPGRYFYLRDQESSDFWSTSWQPVAKPLDCYQSVCRHGTAYTTIESRYADIETESTYFVPLGQAFEYWMLRVANRSKVRRKLSLFTYCEFASNWSTTQDLVNLQYSQYIVRAQKIGSLLEIAINAHLPADPSDFQNNDQGRWSWMTLVGASVSGIESCRDTFLGNYGTYANPETVVRGRCTGSLAFSDNACGVLQSELILEPGESRSLAVLLGVGRAEETGMALVREFGNCERAQVELERVKAYWHSRLGALHVETPDADFDHMANVWNPYNCLITFSWSRTASLVYNGERDGLGYRDTVQDILGVLPLQPQVARERLELMLTGQLANGGAMPTVKPFAHRPGHEKEPPKENFRSDDCLWLFNTVSAYVSETGDTAFYTKVLPYADHGEVSVLGHLRRALEFNLERTGKHRLPCGLEADWNDCLRLGYYGESLFVAFQLRYGLSIYAEIASYFALTAEVNWALEQRRELEHAIQKFGWDHDRFIWAIGEDGTRYGTRDSREGSLYLNTQLWAVLSKAATLQQAETVMETVRQNLATPYGLMLCAPPFIQTPVKVMRAVLFNPGNKENGGIFNHTQGWAVMAECLLGHGDRAYEYHRAYMPSAYNSRAEVRQVEPYVHCQSTHSLFSQKPGVSRLPWLSGTASWSYYSSTQYILGIRPELDGLRIDPCIPKEWPGFRATRQFRGNTIEIKVNNPHHVCRGVSYLVVNGERIEGNLIPANRLSPKVQVQAELSPEK